MRSYDTGLYSILKDGNFKLHISRMDYENDIIVIPSNASDIDEFLALGLTKNHILVEYPKNAYESRKIFWDKYEHFIDSHNMEVLTDITGYNGMMPFSNNFNITKDPNTPRWYIDEFIESDLDSIRRGKKTTVLNQYQKDYLVSIDPSSVSYTHLTLPTILLV